MTEESETQNQGQSEEVEAATERPLSLLAAERFGDKYKGKAPEPQAQPEAGDESESDEVGESQDTDAESEEVEGAEEGQEAEAADSEESEEEPISSWNELIEHQEWDPEWAQSLEMPVKVDGQEKSVPLKELVANYQMTEAAEKRLEEAKSKAKSIQEEAAEKSKAVEESYATAAKLIESAEKLIDDEAANIDWKQLREDDPAEYSAKKQELAERRENIEKMKKDAVETYRNNVQQQQAQTEEERKQILQKEQEALLEHIPEWRDEKAAAEGTAAVAKYLMDSGFSEQDVMAASDHRLIVLARKAMLHDQGKQRADVAKKKVAKVPKVMKPGTPKPKEKRDQEKQAQARKRFDKKRDLDSAFQLLKSRQIGG